MVHLFRRLVDLDISAEDLYREEDFKVVRTAIVQLAGTLTRLDCPDVLLPHLPPLPLLSHISTFSDLEDGGWPSEIQLDSQTFFAQFPNLTHFTGTVFDENALITVPKLVSIKIARYKGEVPSGGVESLAELIAKIPKLKYVAIPKERINLTSQSGIIDIISKFSKPNIDIGIQRLMLSARIKFPKTVTTFLGLVLNTGNLNAINYILNHPAFELATNFNKILMTDATILTEIPVTHLIKTHCPGLHEMFETIINYLVKHNKVDRLCVSNDDGRSFLSILVEASEDKLVKRLVSELGVNVNIGFRGVSNRKAMTTINTLLLRIAKTQPAENIDLFEFLADKGAWFDVQSFRIVSRANIPFFDDDFFKSYFLPRVVSQEISSPYPFAVEGLLRYCNWERYDKFLELMGNKIDHSKTTENGDLPIHLVCNVSKWTDMELFFKVLKNTRREDINRLGSKGLSPFALICKGAKPDKATLLKLRALHEHGADINLVSEKLWFSLVSKLNSKCGNCTRGVILEKFIECDREKFNESMMEEFASDELALGFALKHFKLPD